MEGLEAPKQRIEEQAHKMSPFLHSFPVKPLLNLLTLILCAAVCISVIVGLVQSNHEVLHYVVAIYLFLGSFLLALASAPDHIRRETLKYVLFLATFNGKGALMIFMSILMFGLGVISIIVGIVLLVTGLFHLFLWLFFRDLATDTLYASTKAAMNADAPTYPQDAAEQI
eukprot:TRINITY_DN22308_c0_g1_i1.p1 TRINITY_DN22308_c0_g1~~TRINITY_DN22308_c0_g1_i1.p1  ORF type:complete len:170 (+),score=31.39 TRINITY_DN22308_c0_g1_i1:64-573(+)